MRTQGSFNCLCHHRVMSRAFSETNVQRSTRTFVDEYIGLSSKIVEGGRLFKLIGTPKTGRSGVARCRMLETYTHEAR